MPSPDITKRTRLVDISLRSSAIRSARTLIDHYLTGLDDMAKDVILSSISRLHRSGSWYRVTSKVQDSVLALSEAQRIVNASVNSLKVYDK